MATSQYFSVPRLGNQEVKQVAFIQVANRLHNDTYDYSKAVYGKTTSDKVEIICREHGSFHMTPNSHISAKQGCPKCGKIKRNSTFYKMKDDCELTVFDRARAVHGTKYDYSKFEYRNVNTKSIVICRIHGEFSNSMNKMIYRKQGCPECAKVRSTSSLELNFIKVLDAHHIVYKHQHRFSYKLLPNQKYSYDFFLPDLNLLVELHGPQHYVKKFTMTDKDLEDRRRMDMMKVEEAVDSEYSVAVISYLLEKHMPKILRDIVQRLSKPRSRAEGSRVSYKPMIAETIGSSTVLIYEPEEDEDIV